MQHKTATSSVWPGVIILFSVKVTDGWIRYRHFAGACEGGKPISAPTLFTGGAPVTELTVSSFMAGGTSILLNPGYKPLQWDDFKEAPKCAHDLGMKIFLYVALFDEGWPLLPKKEREVSYHNKMHCQHVSWQSAFSKNNPQYAMVDRSLKNPSLGCFVSGLS